MIRQGLGQDADGPISVMMHEHDEAGVSAPAARATDDYTVPAGRNMWNALWHGLAAMEADLHQHIHPRTTSSPKALAG
jgi:regulator of cell morphogenesis and NO signaling